MWRTLKLGDVCEILDSLRKPITKKFRVEGNIPYYGATGIVDWVADYIFDEKLVLVGEDGAKWASGDKTAFIVEGKTWVNNHAHVLRPKSDILTHEWLAYYLTSIDLSPWVTGLTVPKLNQAQLRSIPIQLPPLAEQRRIVAKLDAAFAEIDRAVQLQKKRTESSVKIFENHLSEIFTAGGDSWATASLKEITTKIGSGATPKGGQASYKDEGISLIRSMNVHDLKMLHKDLAKIDDAQAAKLSNVSVEKNDVLLNITGASVARCALVDSDILPARVNQHVAIIRLKEKFLNPKLLSYMLVSKLYKDKLLAVGEGGGSTRQAITKKQIEEFEITFPNSVEEQRLLVSMLDELNGQTQTLALIYEKQCHHTSALKNAILTQALQPSEAA